MATSPREWLDHAIEIRKARDDETGWRCAGSRAYYAALHAVNKALPEVADLPEVGGRKPKEGAHDRVKRQCTDYVFKKGARHELVFELIRLLGVMKTERTKCDYFLGNAVTGSDADRMIQRAEVVLKTCGHIALAQQQGSAVPAPIATTPPSTHTSSDVPGSDPPSPRLRSV